MASRFVPAAWSMRIRRFDEVVEAGIDHLRGHPAADRLFYGASAVGDHSLVWMAAGALLWLRGGSRRGGHRGLYRRAANRLLVAIPLESLLVNGIIKTVFGRRRPVGDAERPLPLRIPWTSSFPSGHASSALFSATLLADGDPGLAPLYYGGAAVIAASRIYVKIHHPSDVAAGVLVGGALGLLVKRLVPLSR